MKYYIKITETLSRTVPIKADDEHEAIRIAKELYKNEQIVLNSNDYVTTEFTN